MQSSRWGLWNDIYTKSFCVWSTSEVIPKGEVDYSQSTGKYTAWRPYLCIKGAIFWKNVWLCLVSCKHDEMVCNISSTGVITALHDRFQHYYYNWALFKLNPTEIQVSISPMHNMAVALDTCICVKLCSSFFIIRWRLFVLFSASIAFLCLVIGK